MLVWFEFYNQVREMNSIAIFVLSTLQAHITYSNLYHVYFFHKNENKIE